MHAFSRFDIKAPISLFSAGFACVILALWIAIGPQLYTFIHMWKVEVVASVFLLVSIVYILLKRPGKVFDSVISQRELYFVILPMSALVMWSLASALWAPSWRSAIHHSVVWIEYLIFYLIVRHLIDERNNVRILLSVLAAAFVIHSLPAVMEYSAFLYFGGGTTLGIRYAKYGEPVNTISPLLIVSVLRLRGRPYVLGVGAIVMLWLLIFCSLGRINLFLFAVGTAAVALAVFLIPRFRRYRAKMAIIIAAIIFAPFPLHIFSLIAETPAVPIITRVNDTAAVSSSNNFRKLMASLSLEMFTARPLLGIGADNFGSEVNKYRAAYSVRNPTDTNLAAAENELPERAHNEYLQILAELGIIGGVIFAIFLTGLVLAAIRLVMRRSNLFAIAAMTGIVMFLVSSLVSSYSFRFIQNGFIFFFVLAIAAKLLYPKPAERIGYSVSMSHFRLGAGLGMAACLILLAYSTVRVTSSYFVREANLATSMEAAVPSLEVAAKFDPENPDAEHVYGMWLIKERRFAEAIPHLQRMIGLGFATSPKFSYLATAEILSGDAEGAEKTLEHAAILYPRSTFVLTRYAAILRANGKHAQATAEMSRAQAIDVKAANSWWTLINDGPQAATEAAFRSDDRTEVMDLTPVEGIFAILDEREIMYPGERSKIPF